MEKTTTSYRDIEIATEGFSLERLIGKGSHGRVYEGVLQGGKHIVAVKRLHLHGDYSELDNEIQMLSSIKNQHIVNLLAVCQESGQKVLVMEFMANGSMEKLLHSDTEPPSWPRRAAMSLQVAMAIQALHEATPSPIIHRDIKSANVLIDSQHNAKLGDFGLAVRAPSVVLCVRDLLRRGDHFRACSKGGSVETAPAGTIGYIDPCYTTPGKLSTKTDIFSFGVLLLEIVSGRRAMDIGMEPASIVEWAVSLIQQRRTKEIYDARVAMPNHMKRVARRMVRVAARCVSSREEERPSIGEIVAELTTELEQRQLSIRRLLVKASLYLVTKGRGTTRTTTCDSCASEPKGREDARLSIFRTRCRVSDGN